MSNLEYTSFLIRLWREFPEPPVDSQDWLAQVEHIPSGEQQYFTSLEALRLCPRTTARLAPGVDPGR